MRQSTLNQQLRRITSHNYQSENILKRPDKIVGSHFEQRLPTINPEDHMSSSKVYQSIVELNKNYLSEKVKVNNVKKPQLYEHKLPSKTGVSQYNRRYAEGKRSVTLSGSIPQSSRNGQLMKLPNAQITNLKTSYQIEFSVGKKSSLPAVFLDNQAKKQDVLHRDQRPFFKETAYQREYNFRGNVQTLPAKRLGNIAVGGIFNAQSTYKNNYKGKNYLKTLPASPILPRQHKIFVKVNSPEKSNYQQSYLENQMAHEASFKPPKKYPPQFKTLGLKSQYKKAYEKKQQEKNGDFDYLDEQKLLKYVLTIPKH